MTEFKASAAAAPSVQARTGELVAAGDVRGALKLYQEQEERCRADDNDHDLETCLAQQSGLHARLGEFDLALEKNQAHVKLSQKLGGGRLLGALSNRGMLLVKAGRPQEGFALMIEQEKELEALGASMHLAYAKLNRAVLLEGMGATSDALTLARQAMPMFQAEKSEDGIAKCTRVLKRLEATMG